MSIPAEQLHHEAMPKSSLISAQLRSDVQSVIDKQFANIAPYFDAHKVLAATDFALFKVIILDALKKQIEEQRGQEFDSVTGHAAVMDMVDECIASESKITEFGCMALQLSKSKAPETLDGKSLVTQLRASYGKVIDKTFVDALVKQCTKLGEPRKTFKIIQL